MLIKIAVVLFSCCAVALARPQDANAAQTPNQPQPANPGQGPNPNQALDWYQLQKLYPQLEGYYPVKKENLIFGTGYDNKNQYKTPILEVPNRAIDFGQQLVDNSLSSVGAALGNAFDKTGKVAHNVIDTVSEVGERGLRDGASLIKGGLGLFGVIPKIGLGLLTRQP